ncbi:hypothetical protein [Ktedonobacter racemifer]|uniref:Uncharacterized protein n=1 Tax=Ktedonobacter racemifer DSM 44963 TaxID=485913 RepID=D6TLG3_KTERA|nr:hypothetical protein [Ktedonobacter racemifer]EFH86613.1 hypothetical protein Krac_7918 [Ktedonobacter racemifer DSM 44963]
MSLACLYLAEGRSSDEEIDDNHGYAYTQIVFPIYSRQNQRLITHSRIVRQPGLLPGD